MLGNVQQGKILAIVAVAALLGLSGCARHGPGYAHHGGYYPHYSAYGHSSGHRDHRRHHYGYGGRYRQHYGGHYRHHYY